MTSIFRFAGQLNLTHPSVPGGAIIQCDGGAHKSNNGLYKRGGCAFYGM